MSDFVSRRPSRVTRFSPHPTHDKALSSGLRKRSTMHSQYHEEKKNVNAVREGRNKHESHLDRETTTSNTGRPAELVRVDSLEKAGSRCLHFES